MRRLWGLLMVHLLFVSMLLADSTLPRAAIIFDASGSMWGRIDGKAKITIAKKALSDVVQHWNREMPLGLTIYGHRRKADCNDIETVIPSGPLEKRKMLSIIEHTRPKGKTPIVRSLQKVAKELDYTKHKSVIILISDGRETCDHDPLKKIETLKRRGLDLVVHVIGFDVDKETSKQLQSIARITGGEYLPAKDAASLDKAFATLAKKVHETKPAPAPKYNLLISASETGGGAWVQALHEIYREDGNLSSPSVESCLSYRKSPCRIKLESGDYIVRSTYTTYEKKSHIETCEHNVTRLHVIMGRTGKVSITAREARGAPAIVLHFGIYTDPGQKLLLGGDTVIDRALIERLPVGNYILRYTYHTYRKALSFRVMAGKQTAIDILAGKTGEIAISASELKGGKWVDASYDLYRLKEHGSIERNATATCYSTEARACRRRIPVGPYLIKTRYRDLEVETTVEIPYRKQITKHIVLKPTGTLEIIAREWEHGEPVSADYRIFRGDTGSTGKRIAVSSGKTDINKSVVLRLFAGKYKIEAEYCGYDKNFTTEVRADRAERLTMLMGRMGGAEIAAVLQKDGQPVEASYVLYREENGTSDLIGAVCSVHSGSRYHLRLPVGDYRVKAEFAPFEQTKKFHIDAGKTTKVLFVLNPSGRVRISTTEALNKKRVRATHDIYRIVNGEINASALFRTCQSEGNRSCELKLPTGNYLLDTTYNHFRKKTPFEIKEDQTLSLNIVMGQTGTVDIVAYEEKGGKPIKSAVYYIYEMEGHQSRSVSITDCWHDEHCVRRLPAGHYLVRAEYNLLTKKKDFEIREGETTHISLLMGRVGKAILYTTILPSGKRVAADQAFYQTGKSGGRRELSIMCWYDEKIGGCPVSLPEGEYLVRTSYKTETKDTTFTISGGGVQRVDIVLETGKEHNQTER